MIGHEFLRTYAVTFDFDGMMVVFHCSKTHVREQTVGHAAAATSVDHLRGRRLG